MANMRDLIDKLNEIESKPSIGDGFFLELGENVEIETEILEITEDGDIIVAGDDKVITILEDLKKFERQQLNEIAPLVLLGLIGGTSAVGGAISTYLFGSPVFGGGASPAGEFSDMSLKSQAYNLARATGENDQAARAFADRIEQLGPNSPEAKQVIDQFQGMQQGVAKDIVSKTDDYVADKSEAAKLAAQDTFKDTKDAFAKIQATVQDNLPTDTIAKMAQYAKQYALPGAAIVAILYGGKKLYDYLTSDSKRAVAEQQEYDKTSGGPYDRGSADAYYGRPPRPHKMAPVVGGVQGQMERVPLTDPKEIAAYNAGYSEEDDRKDYGESISEAKYQGRSVPLGKPMRGDVKKFKVYVRNPATGNIKKVNFGDKKMRIKKSNPKRRKSFRARHNCANPGPRTKARYWSCRKW